MKIEAAKLREHLRFLGSASDKRGRIPIYAHLLWEPIRTGVRLTASDGSSLAVVEVECEEAGEAAAIPLPQLDRIAGIASSEVKIEVPGMHALVTWESGNATIACMRAEDFPSARMVDPEYRPVPGLLAAMEAVVHATDWAAIETLRGVAVWPSMIAAAATDEHMAFVSGDPGESADLVVLAPEAVFGMMRLGDAEEAAWGNGWFAMRRDGLAYMTRVLDPSKASVPTVAPPRVRVMLNQSCDRPSVRVGRDALLRVVRAMHSIVGNESYVELSVDGDTLRFKARTDIASLAESIPCVSRNLPPGGVVIGVGSHLFPLFVESLVGEEVELRLPTDAASPICFEANKEWRVIMPRTAPRGWA